MPKYAHYKGRRYDLGTSKEKFILYWYDEKNIPKCFNEVYNPDGAVKANKFIYPTEKVDCAYEERFGVIYKGIEFPYFAYSEEKYVILGYDQDICRKLDFELWEPSLYRKWISPEEGHLRAYITEINSSYKDRYIYDYLEFRFKEDGYQKGELYTYYNGQRYKVKEEEGDSYLIDWSVDGDLTGGLPTKWIYKSQTQYTYREYIMARYKEKDNLINDVSGDQVLIEDSQNLSKWVPKSEIIIWLERDTINGHYKTDF